MIVQAGAGIVGVSAMQDRQRRQRPIQVAEHSGFAGRIPWAIGMASDFPESGSSVHARDDVLGDL